MLVPRRALLFLAFLLLIFALWVCLSNTTRNQHEDLGNANDPTASPARIHENNDGNTEKDDARRESIAEHRLGLLTVVQGDGLGAPTRADMLKRYRSLFLRFFPMAPATAPKTYEDVSGDVPILVFVGSLRVTFGKNTGQVHRVRNHKRCREIDDAAGEITQDSLLVAKEKKEVYRELKNILKEKLGITLLDQDGTLAITKRLYNGKKLYTLKWFINYYGYPHLHDGLRASFELQEDGFHLYDVVCLGGKLKPMKPKCNITQQEAEEIARRTLSQYFNKSKLRFQLKQVNCRKAFVYRNDLFRLPAMLYGEWLTVHERQETHFCYIVRFTHSLPSSDEDGGTAIIPPASVYVDCLDGSVVGGEY